MMFFRSKNSTPKGERARAEWRKKLTAEQFRVLFDKIPEIPFTGRYWNCHEKGVYCCAACGSNLFRSDAKFDCATGWPSFIEPMTPKSVETNDDVSLGLERTEVVCASCGGHLGHVFNDGPRPGTKRYSVNSLALDLKKT
jgi:peptide-methionine (R)-S-oxide reductase